MRSESVRSKLARLRSEMRKQQLAAYLVPQTDPHQSEYVPEHWQRRRWLSGFSGSAGELVVGLRQAALFTDGRYTLQAQHELRGSTIRAHVLGKPLMQSVGSWLVETLRAGETVGVDPRLLSQAAAQRLQRTLEARGLKLWLSTDNLVDRLWQPPPPPPSAPIVTQPETFAGRSVREKLGDVRQALARRGADALVVTALDNVAWLFNLRGSDIAHTPVALAYAVVTRERAVLCCDIERSTTQLRRALGRKVQLAPYQAMGRVVRELATRQSRIWADTRKTNSWIMQQLERCTLVDEPSPIAELQARKNPTEVAGIARAHLRDGVALVRFFAWLESAVQRQRITELNAAAKLRELRAEGEHFRDESFASIVGYGAHGAIVHYSATAASNVALRARGLLLVDSGGQYLDGTTDVTRTVLLGGQATRAQKEHYTRVLKGHIALASCRFPRGTTGRQLEAFARAPLWEAGLDYAHGTGHGVGAYLGVHESPPSLSQRDAGAPLEPGHVLSIEPGYYAAGAYGIRLENLALVVEDAPPKHAAGSPPPFLRFATLTLCPFDARLIAPALLTPRGRAWLAAYHAHVRRQLTPHLPSEARAWLAQQS